MRSLPPARIGLLSLALLAAASSAQAAPVPVKTPVPPLEKYLLDDADFVAVVNVKQVAAAPLFTKNFLKMTEAALKTEPAQKFLKDAGFDPLKDVDRVLVVVGKSCHSDTRPAKNEGPVFVVEGKFDAAKLHAKMAKLAKDGGTPGIKVHDEKAGKVYEVGGEYFAALVDKGGTIVLAPQKAMVEDAFAKAAGKKKTKLKYAKELAPILKGFKPDVAVQAVGLESMILNSTGGGGPGAPAMVRHETLGSNGIKDLRVTVHVKDEVKGNVVLTGKDKAEFAKKAKTISDGLAEAKAQLGMVAAMEPKLKPLITLLENIKATTEKETLIFEGKADAETLKGLVELMRAGPF